MASGGERGDWEIGGFAGYAFLDRYGISDRDAGQDLLIPDDDLNPDGDVFFGLRVGYFFNAQVSMEGTFQTLSGDVEFDRCTGIPCRPRQASTAHSPTVGDMDLDSFRVNVLYHWREGARLRPFLTAGIGLEATEVVERNLGIILDETDISYNAGAGLRWFFTDLLSLRVDARYVLTDASGLVNDFQETLESSIGFSFTFGGASPVDTDGDTVNDRKDKCPLTPQGAIIDETGCALDADGDGVPDGIDLCNDSTPGAQVTSRGCPRDDDQDGVVNEQDECPGTPRRATVGPSGCSRDSDGDGHLDGLDACPDTPLGAIVDDKGCPKDDDGDGVFNGLDRCPRTRRGDQVDAAGCLMDDDGDGVHNGVDACPDTPGGIQVDRIGCPLAPPVEEEPLVLEGVKFELNSAELTADSYPALERVVASLAGWSGGRIEIGGHTDSMGDADQNQDLSRRRAEAVRDYLRSHGVNDDILVVRGYGESQPIADNSSPEGRGENRRVTLRLVD
jgi:outer membrane protein OmpA-like peptidoglycan-associated protein/opacity protein-like surface antigen